MSILLSDGPGLTRAKPPRSLAVDNSNEPGQAGQDQAGNLLNNQASFLALLQRCT